jgi:hypothetical protein
MNPPPPTDPQLGERIANVVEIGAKVSIGLGGVWAFVAKVAKPFLEWRRATRLKERAEMEKQMREMFAPELQAFTRLSESVGRIDVLFEDHDLLLDIALDNRERHDETNALLDFLGFTSDRRASDERREKVAEMVLTLSERRKERRRQGD